MPPKKLVKCLGIGFRSKNEYAPKKVGKSLNLPPKKLVNCLGIGCRSTKTESFPQKVGKISRNRI